MSAIQQLPKPEQLVDLVSHAAAVKLAMDGEFDAKIKELKAAQAALAKTTSIVETLKEAQKVKDDADAYTVAALEKANQALARARDATDKVASREATVTGREQAVSSRETAADARQKAQDIREEAMLNASLVAATTVEARAVALKKNEDDYTARKKQLDADIRAFNQKLEALKV